MRYDSRNDHNSWNHNREQNRQNEGYHHRQNQNSGQNWRPFNHQDGWGPEGNQRNWNQSQFSPNRNEWNTDDRYRRNSERDSYNQHQAGGYRHHESDQYQARNNQSGYGQTERGWSANQAHENRDRGQSAYRSDDEWNGRNRSYPDFDSERTSYGSQNQPRNTGNHGNGGGIGRVAAVGGSFTSYSASRSRTGSMGHGSPGGAIHRDGPGMNSYSRGDINANSNW